MIVVLVIHNEIRKLIKTLEPNQKHWKFLINYYYSKDKMQFRQKFF